MRTTTQLNNAYHNHSDVKGRERIHKSKVYDKIMTPDRKPLNIVKNKDLCQCKICDKFLDILTHTHAEKQGYKDKWEMIADNKVQFFYEEGERHANKRPKTLAAHS